MSFMFNPYPYGDPNAINYPEFPAMKPIEEAAKAGEYKDAKSELLYYMKNREKNYGI